MPTMPTMPTMPAMPTMPTEEQPKRQTEWRKQSQWQSDHNLTITKTIKGNKKRLACNDRGLAATCKPLKGSRWSAKSSDTGQHSQFLQYFLDIFLNFCLTWKRSPRQFYSPALPGLASASWCPHTRGQKSSPGLIVCMECFLTHTKIYSSSLKPVSLREGRGRQTRNQDPRSLAPDQSVDMGNQR